MRAPHTPPQGWGGVGCGRTHRASVTAMGHPREVRPPPRGLTGKRCGGCFGIRLGVGGSATRSWHANHRNAGAHAQPATMKAREGMSTAKGRPRLG